LTVYIAAPLAFYTDANRVAYDLEKVGVCVTSTWHHDVAKLRDVYDLVEPDDDVTAARQLVDDRRKFCEARCLVALVRNIASHTICASTFCLVGEALAHGMPVVWVHAPDSRRGFSPSRSIYDVEAAARIDDLREIPATVLRVLRQVSR
jgi:hypothetical protein